MMIFDSPKSAYFPTPVCRKSSSCTRARPRMKSVHIKITKDCQRAGHKSSVQDTTATSTQAHHVLQGQACIHLVQRRALARKRDVGGHEVTVDVAVRVAAGSQSS
jgi:hypothetical protein